MIWGRSWIAWGRLMPAALFVIVGIVYTGFSEDYNVSVAQSRGYSRWMPTIGSIGLVPIIQWLLVPLLVIHFAGKLESSNLHQRGITAG